MAQQARHSVFTEKRRIRGLKLTGKNKLFV